MSRYRKIEVRIWADDKFRALSPLPPSGQSLWLFLLTGPHTGPVPGLFRAGQMAMAEELGWEPEAFQEAFREVFREGMAKADWKNRVVWIPKAINHNMPQSPNVIRSWEEELKIIPGCSLKTEALQGIRAALELLGASYLSVFDSIAQLKPFGKPFRKPFGKSMPNQDQQQQQQQEQKQEQEKNILAQAPETQTGTPIVSPTDHPSTTTLPPKDCGTDEFDAFWREYPQRAGGNPKTSAFKAWNARRKEGYSADEILSGTQRYAAYCTATSKVGGEYVKQAQTFINQKAFLEAWDLPVEPPPPRNGQRPPIAATKHDHLIDHNRQAINAWLTPQNVIEGECHEVH